jgi:hypothetical protein
MTKVKEFHQRWSKDPGYRKANDELEDEYALIGALIDARAAGPADAMPGSGR